MVIIPQKPLGLVILFFKPHPTNVPEGVLQLVAGVCECP